MAQSQRRSCEPRPAEGDVGDRALPHGGARRPCRALREVRPHPHRLQLLPQPPLPQVPGRGGEGSGWPTARPSCLPVPYFHVVFTLPAPIADIAYQNKAAIYDHPVQGRGRDADHHRRRPQASRRPHRPHRRAPHLGLGAHPSSARPLHRAGRRPLARWRALDLLPAGLLPARARALAAVPPAVPGAARRGPRGRPPPLLRRSRAARRAPRLRGAIWRRCARSSGSSMPSGPSPGRRRCSPISAATPTASPSPTAG